MVATSDTATPRSSARSRSKLTVSCGLLTRRSLSTLTRPGICRARASRVSFPLASRSKSGCWMTKFTGLPQPKAGGIIGKREDAGNPEVLPLDLVHDVHHRAVAIGPVLQVGEDDSSTHPVPDVHHAEEAARSSLVLARIASARRWYPSVYASEEPSGAMMKVKNQPRSSAGRTPA